MCVLWLAHWSHFGEHLAHGEGMKLDALKQLIESAGWFANLGKASAATGRLPITDSEWQQFINLSMRAEFGLSHDINVVEKGPFEEMIWLPTSNEEPDPVHGLGLEEAAHRLNRVDEFKTARIDVYRLVLASQRKVPELLLLKVGNTDLNISARMAGRYACRMAASEIVVDQVGFWCDTVQLFHEGHWPLGLLPSGEIVVL